MDNGWSPILDGREREIAIDFVYHAARCIEIFLTEARSTGSLDQLDPDFDFTVASGRAGYALFYCYFYLLTSEKAALEQCTSCLMDAAYALSEGQWSPSLYAGLAGVGWTIDHVSDALGDQIECRDELSELTDQIDDFILKWLSKDVEFFDYDLINGLVGIGIYCLSRLPRRIARDSIGRIIQKLVNHSIRDQAGICWFTPAAAIPASQLATFPNGYYNLGIAHGIPGVIAFLSRVYEAGVATRETETLLRGSISWLMHQRLRSDLISSFAIAASPDSGPQPARLAWCYGDPGVAASLLGAAYALKDRSMIEASLAIARKAQHRTWENSGVIDASFCHGAYGVAHIFNRIYHATREQAFLDSALYWLSRGASMRNVEDSVCGYTFYVPDTSGKMCWRNTFGLLVGISGVAMTVLAALSTEAPRWDRLFLLDIESSS